MLTHDIPYVIICPNMRCVNTPVLPPHLPMSNRILWFCWHTWTPHNFTVLYLETGQVKNAIRRGGSGVTYQSERIALSGTPSSGVQPLGVAWKWANLKSPYGVDYHDSSCLDVSVSIYQKCEMDRILIHLICGMLTFVIWHAIARFSRYRKVCYSMPYVPC